MYVNLPKITFPESIAITIMKNTPTRNNMGEIADDWADSGDLTVNGEIWALKGTSRYGSSHSEVGITEKSTHKLFTVDVVESNVRIFANGKTYLTGYQQSWGTHNEIILEQIF